jgi:mannosyltransferase
VLASAATLPVLGKSLWLDEGASLYSAHLRWSALWRQSTIVDRVFLAYYAVLHLWVEISASIEWVRFLSVIAFGLTVVLIGHLGHRLGGFWCGVIAAVLTATNPLMIDAALDARPYALSALTATIAIYSLLRWRDSARDHWFWLFCFASLAALALHVFAILGPLAVLAVMLLVSPATLRRSWRRIVVPLGATLVLSALYALVVLGQRSQVAWIPPMSVTTLAADAYGPAGGYPRLGRELYAALIVVLVVSGLVLLWRGQHRRIENVDRSTRANMATALAWAALPTLGLIAVSFVKPIYVDRYVTASAPGLALAVGLILTQTLKLNDPERPTKHRRVEGIATGITVVVLIANFIMIASPPYANYLGVAQYLHHQVGATGEIALPDHSVKASIEYYLHDSHESPRLWPENSSQLFIMSLDLRENQTAFISAEPNVWVVEDGTTGLGAFLDNLTRHGYVLVGKRQFVKSLVVTVAHYERSGE